MNAFREFSNIILSFIRQYWKYKFRDLAMSFATLVFGSGVTLLLSGGLWKLAILFDIYGIQSGIYFDSNDFSSLGIILILFGLAIGILRLRDLSTKITGIVIVHRGMEGMDTNNIEKTLPKHLSRGLLSIVDLHEGHQLYEGKVVHPERALDTVNGIDQQISSRLNGRDINNVTIAYAGLAPIPLLVTAGYKITSRQNCIILDYSRTSSWHSLDDIDDMENISIISPTGAIKNKVSIVLPLSAEITKSQIPPEFHEASYFLRLQNGARSDSLNSEDKQKRLATKFYNLCSNIKADHAELTEIHVFMAAQASFCFRIGTMITTSVMPKITVYQYDSASNQYSWGVVFSSGQKPTIVGDRT